MRVCKYLDQRVRRIGEYNRKSFSGISKTKKKKKNRLSFITQFKIVFLLSFTSCRKMYRKFWSAKFLHITWNDEVST